MKRGACDPKMHHYVPKSYLARFCDEDGFLHILDRSSGQYRRQRPKEVMKINSYYRQDWAPAGIDQNIFEKTLGEWLEAEAKDSIDRLIDLPASLTDQDTATLLIYIELQRIRVPRQAEAAKKQMREVVLRLAPADALEAIQSGKVVLTIKDSARFDYMRMVTGKLHPWFGKMEWEVFKAEADASFVTTDSPVSLYNAVAPPPAEPGLALAGTMVFFPLSSRHVLLMRHSEYRLNENISPIEVLPEPSVEDGHISITHGAIWEKEAVNEFNWKMMQLSNKLVVGNSRKILQECIASHPDHANAA
jgi:hypothetical protein